MKDDIYAQNPKLIFPSKLNIWFFFKLAVSKAKNILQVCICQLIYPECFMTLEQQNILSDEYKSFMNFLHAMISMSKWSQSLNMWVCLKGQVTYSKQTGTLNHTKLALSQDWLPVKHKFTLRRAVFHGFNSMYQGLNQKCPLCLTSSCHSLLSFLKPLRAFFGS